MPKTLMKKWWIAAAAVAALAGISSAHAAPCTATHVGWDPNPTVENSVACGPGNTQNDTATDLNAAENAPGFNLSWTQLDRDESPDVLGSVDNGFRFIGTTSGFWFIDKDNPALKGFDTFSLVLKDGSTAADPIRWAWFILDSNAVLLDRCIGNMQSNVEDYCGSWSMYGDAVGNNAGTMKDISHMTLYGANADAPPQEVPEPGSPALVGLALLAVWAARRRKI